MNNLHTFKRIFALLLTLCCLATSLPIVQAVQAQSVSRFSYVDTASGDIYTFEEVSRQAKNSIANGLEDYTATIRLYINGEFVEQVYANIATNTIQTTYPDGKTVEKRISDIVTFADVSKSKVSFERRTGGVNADSVSNGGISPLATTDYIGSEPFAINSRRVQAALPGAATYYGYQAMGSRSYTYPQNVSVYLQRKNSGVEDTFQSKRFNISAGTTISTLVSIIVAALNPYGMIASIATSLITSAIGVSIDYARSATITVVQFRWDYRLRLNSNTGVIIEEHTRLKDFWEMYVAETDSFAYEYRPGYDDGTFLLSNSEMIHLAILDFFSGG